MFSNSLESVLLAVCGLVSITYFINKCTVYVCDVVFAKRHAVPVRTVGECSRLHWAYCNIVILTNLLTMVVLFFCHIHVLCNNG